MTLIGRIILSVILFLAIVSGGYAVFQQREMADGFARLQDAETGRQIELANEAVRRQVGQMRTMASILGMRDDVRLALERRTAASLGVDFANQLGALTLGAGVVMTRLTTIEGETIHESAMGVMDGDSLTTLSGEREMLERSRLASLRSGRPQVDFLCADACLILVWAPVLGGSRPVGTALTVAPLADILLSFYRVAGAEVGLVRRDMAGPAPIAMTGGDEARQLLSGLSDRWHRSAETGGEWQQIAVAGKQYRASRWSSVFESTRLPVDFVSLADVTATRREMDEALRTSVVAALGWMLLASTVVWLLSRRLIARLRRIGDAIRGLESDSGAATRARLASETRAVSDDELGRLARVVVDVAQRLDDGEAEAQRRQDELRATLTDLERARAFTAGLLEAAPVLVLVTDGQGRITLANRLARELGGWSVGALLAEHLLTDRRGERPRLLAGPRERGEPVRRSTLLIRADSEPRNIEWLHCALPPEADGEPTLLSIGQDVTSLRHAREEQEQLQRQLQQAHKMEAIGQLAGGIAHDFNNILASIMGYAVLARDRFARDGGDRLARYLGEILQASERARDLVAQLLTFSRQEVSGNPQRMQLEPLLKELGRMLAPLLPATMALRLDLRPAPAVLANPLQIQQIVMNLAINARDATGARGALTVSLGYPVDIDTTCASCHGPVSGRFVELAVADNGPGIAPEHLTRIFEPFFTTKDPGKGTGMGLAIVHGLVHEGGGHLIIDAVPGGGTVFRVLLPAAEETPAPGPARAERRR